MFSFLIATLFLAALLFLGFGIYKAVAQVAAHVRRNPEAGKAIFDHVFMPLFEEGKAPKSSEPKANPD